ncbi:MAG: ATP-binding protein [Ignavibacteria bacterium]|nr:ATP-binding protein [Ignavibacteria bacterium]
MPFKRPQFKILLARLQEPRRFIQVLAGPRQSGKTTIAQQVVEALKIPSHYASADEPALRATAWIDQQWESARLLTAKTNRAGAVLLLDEIQKIPGWSETVKRLWDADTKNKVPLRVALLGSAPLLVQQGLTESLAGRFEIIPVTHWSFIEMKGAFGWSVEEFIYYGGYPGSASLIRDHERWTQYIVHSLIETTISRDILLMTRVDKPALLRRLFQLGCSSSGQIVSYQKLVGQLQDAGNTTTLAHYLELLHGAGMLAGLKKYSGKQIRQRASSPKLLVLNTALISAQVDAPLAQARRQPDLWGRLVESSVGAHLVNGCVGSALRVFYWREGGKEVDFILQQGKALTAVEVKSGRERESLAGIDAFSNRYRPRRKLLVGSGGIALEEFLSLSPSRWLE